MQRTRSRIAMIVVSTFAIAALTFGAREVLADTASSCFYNPPSKLGECTSEQLVVMKLSLAKVQPVRAKS